ncbi:MAG: PKD domain-containing protein [Flavobacteriales bacterium]
MSLTVGNGCVYEVTGSLFLNTSPQASFTYSIDAGPTVTFNNTSTISAGSIASNAWDFGDGQKAADASPIHTYAAGGSYTVTLTIASALGCESSYSQSINTVGVNELEQINLSVYPNPAVDQITVTFNHPIQLDILDVNGRVVYTNVGILWSSPSTVWVGDLSSGLYVIRAFQGSSIVTRNIVIE